jgi:CRP-like cAMP-binding protein
MDQQERVGQIAGVSVFSGLDQGQLELLAAHFVERRCASGEALMLEGEKGQQLSIITSGQVRVFLPEAGPNQRPEELELANLRSGDVFGEYSFIDLRPASASVVATEPTVVLQIGQQELYSLLSDHCEIARQVYYNLLLTLIDRLRADDRELDAFTNSWG